MARWIPVTVTLTAALVVAAVTPSPTTATQGPARRRATPSPGWKDAAPGRLIVLPRDHASHPDFKIEWWYYTGNLNAADGRRFGYQVTFFRIGVDPMPANPSRWAVRDLFMAHLAVSDVDGKQYRFADRMNRTGPGWAGAATDRYRVWNEDWQATLDPDGTHRLTATTADFGVDLTLAPGKPPVLHGDRGYSRKGSTPGNASHYYSLTRMPTRGTIVAGGRRIAVTGTSWMDHEFGTSFLEPTQVGWDWFSIQLDDGRELMLFELRQKDGGVDPRSSGTLVDADGAATPVRLDSGFRLEPGRRWTSRASGATYPVEWRVRVPAAALDLAVSAALDDQELRTERSTGVTYWEGAVDVAGTSGGRRVAGRGYLEMTGYSGQVMGDFLR
ncbi:MAG: carotenoid 1,2-hydratase [Acidobacteria bacterium]|nr:carotenoid 1,2-hydratase [Acidobacteriota bacterium]